MAKKKTKSADSEDENIEENENIDDMKESEFWSNAGKVEKEIEKPNIGNIEKSMSEGVSSVFRLVEQQITNLTRTERIAYATLKDDPLFGPYIESMITTKRHEKAWFTKILGKFWDPFVKAFHSIYQNKQIQRALRKSGYGGFNDNNFIGGD